MTIAWSIESALATCPDWRYDHERDFLRIRVARVPAQVLGQRDDRLGMLLHPLQRHRLVERGGIAVFHQRRVGFRDRGGAPEVEAALSFWLWFAKITPTFSYTCGSFWNSVLAWRKSTSAESLSPPRSFSMPALARIAQAVLAVARDVDLTVGLELLRLGERAVGARDVALREVAPAQVVPGPTARALAAGGDLGAQDPHGLVERRRALGRVLVLETGLERLLAVADLARRS